MPNLESMREEYNRLRAGDVLAGLTGKSGQDIADMAIRGQGPIKSSVGREDRPVHALTAKLISDKFGPVVADVLGMGNEVLGGAMSAAQGQGFGGETGFDVQDLMANQTGVAASSKERQANMQRDFPAELKAGGTKGAENAMFSQNVSSFLKDLFGGQQ